MKLFLDENLSPAQAMKLREEGFDAISLYEVGLGGSPDEEVRKFAIKIARVLATATPPTEEAIRVQLRTAL